MRPTDSGDHLLVSPKPNGDPRRRRIPPTRTPPSAVETQKLADFAAMETPATEAQMWPVHAMAWLQPGSMTATPCSSGLRLERRHRVPVPGFVPAPVAATTQAPPIREQCQPRLPEMPRGIPPCGLAPLGWDPRTACAAAGDYSHTSAASAAAKEVPE